VLAPPTHRNRETQTSKLEDHPWSTSALTFKVYRELHSILVGNGLLQPPPKEAPCRGDKELIQHGKSTFTIQIFVAIDTQVNPSHQSCADIWQVTGINL
jgi:hypothetical protein